MASYVVLEAPGGREAPVLVRDSFRWPAFLVPLLWFLWHRLWIEALVVLAVMVCLAALVEMSVPAPVMVGLAFLLALAFGFEAPALRMAALRRRGWKETGVVDAENHDEAEIRHLSGIDEADEADEPASAPPAASPARDARALVARPRQPGLGLLDYPGGA
jgi:hypothetical protein